MLKIETGVGIRGANTYVDVAYVTNYLTVRNRHSARVYGKRAGMTAPRYDRR